MAAACCCSDGVDGYEWDWFETSVPMSTYLVAVVVADYSYVESKVESGGVSFRIWARHSAINQTNYGLDVGPRILKLYEDYFGIDFPLPKLDMIALPEFGGAMENWGLVTYGYHFPLHFYPFHESADELRSMQRAVLVVRPQRHGPVQSRNGGARHRPRTSTPVVWQSR